MRRGEDVGSGSALDLLIDMVSVAHSSALITIPVHPAAVLSTLSSLLAYGVRLALIVLLVWLSRRRAFFAIPPLAGAFVLQLGAWTAWFVIASRHKVAEVPLATATPAAHR